LKGALILYLKQGEIKRKGVGAMEPSIAELYLLTAKNFLGMSS